MKKILSPSAVEKLISWYEKNQREFVWRKNPNPYHVWLAEVMSQQTQMATLMPYFFRFTETFKTVHDLANASEEDVMRLWAGLGYYSRARNLHKCAGVLSKNGFPETVQGWMELPGVGPYTAAAIASQCFGVMAPVFDGNVLRVCARILKVSNAHTPKFKAETLGLLKTAMIEGKASEFNQAFMELGAVVCTPKNPKCEICPISKYCEGKSDPSKYPAAKSRKKAIEVNAEMWVYQNRDEVFLVPRKKGEWFSGLYDFVSELGGVVKPVQKLDYKVKEKRKIGEIKHSITHHKIKLTVYRIQKKPPVALKGKWIHLDALCSSHPPVPVATTTKKVIRLLK